ncbi:PHB depolymerase family esterase [Variovorax sp. J22R133]|uniref:extracellular catalytic domain type 1 short-chain-length polyhydroxyalkanoate depolymerase n=1 Tax=Variovorax brevis TaxID=3053503 RepID=UPI00257714B9|nr:PHB depolymerase family esterase [Variovorax sp. J22R133]MDM0112859.1 PHB depolymerase family esterase [Variovorax sp. J22R133]
MARRRSSATSVLAKAYERNLKAMTRATLAGSKRIAGQVQRAAVRMNRPPPGPGDWLPGVALGPAGARRFHLYRPPGLQPAPGEKLPLMVMLHGCGQTGRDFAVSTRMNRLASREGFLVLYPEQDRLANAQGCWNWFERRSGKADAEAATLMSAIDQVSTLYGVDRDRIAIAGLSAGASMAALLATRYPTRFKAVAMHSGVAPGAAKSATTALGAMRGQHTAPTLTTAVGKAMGAAAVFTTLPPLLVLHGDADRVVALNNAHSSALIWATATGARSGDARTLQRGNRYAAQLTDYKRKGRTLVTVCEVAGLGHAWSGGLGSQAFSDSSGPDATRMVWAFALRAFRAATTATAAPGP